jgi:glycosyl hydrolase family 12
MRRRSLLTAALTVPLATAGAVGLESTAQAAAWSSSDDWAEWTDGAYTVRNHVWGSGAGPQTIWADSYSNWGVWADHPNTSGIKSYPHALYTLGRDVWSMGDVSSNHNVTVPSGSDLAYCTTYDVWGNGTDYEIMIWTQFTSNVGPIGSYVTDVNLGSRDWAYYQGSNGSNAVHSFLARSQTTDSWVDITAHCQWLVNQGQMPQVQIDDIAFGFEITSSAGGHNFICNSYDVWA